MCKKKKCRRRVNIAESVAMERRVLAMVEGGKNSCVGFVVAGNRKSINFKSGYL